MNRHDRYDSIYSMTKPYLLRLKSEDDLNNRPKVDWKQPEIHFISQGHYRISFLPLYLIKSFRRIG